MSLTNSQRRRGRTSVASQGAALGELSGELQATARELQELGVALAAALRAEHERAEAWKATCEYLMRQLHSEPHDDSFNETLARAWRAEKGSE